MTREQKERQLKFRAYIAVKALEREDLSPVCIAAWEKEIEKIKGKEKSYDRN